jgi:soluble lytic murein transglycosylase-like protein
MQINYKYWKDEKGLNMVNIFDKNTNIKAGLEIYNYYLRVANGDKKLALFYYNNGTAPQTPNYSYAPTVLRSKFMRMATYEPINIEKSQGISQ